MFRRPRRPPSLWRARSRLRRRLPSAAPQHANGQQQGPGNGQAGQPAAQPAQHQEPAARPPRTVTFDEGDDLDVPDFLK